MIARDIDKEPADDIIYVTICCMGSSQCLRRGRSSGLVFSGLAHDGERKLGTVNCSSRYFVPVP
jgi:hypothetical protein